MILGPYLYGFNTFTFTFLGGLAPGIALLYSLAPLVIMYLIKILQANSLSQANVLKFTLLLSLTLMFNYEAIIELSPFLAIVTTYYGIVRRNLSYRAMIVGVAEVCGIVVTLFPFTYLIPLLTSPKIGGQILSASTLAYFVQGIPGTYSNPQVVELRTFFSVATVAFISPVLFLRSRLRITIYSVFLSTSSLVVLFWYVYPNREVLAFLTHVPFGAVLFAWGDPIKLVMLLAISYSVMVPIAIDAISLRSNIACPHFGINRRILLAGCYVALLVLPLYAYGGLPGQSGSQYDLHNYAQAPDLSNYQVPTSYGGSRDWLVRHNWDRTSFRVAWLPLDPNSLAIVQSFIPNVFYSFDNETNARVFSELTSLDAFSLGSVAGSFNIQYVVINLDNQPPNDWHAGQPRLLGWGNNWYPIGDPHEFVRISERQPSLRIVASTPDFLIFQNLRFVPKISAYDNVVLRAPSELVDTTYHLKVYNFSNNLVTNPEFSGGLSDWNASPLDDWSIEAASLSFALPAAVSTQAKGRYSQTYLITHVQPIDPNVSYYFSSSMRIQNAGQANIAVVFWSSQTRNRTVTIYPQSGIDGSRDWWNVSAYVQPPPATDSAFIYLVGGWSLDGRNPGKTWFGDIRFEQAYVPLENSVATSIDSTPAILSSVPKFNDSFVYILNENSASTEIRKSYAQISQLVFFPGNIVDESGVGLFSSKPVVFAYQAASAFTPLVGHLTTLVGRPDSPRAVYMNGTASSEMKFVAPYNGFYRISARIETEGNPWLVVDNQDAGFFTIAVQGLTLSWYESPVVYLFKGVHRMEYRFNGRNTVVDQLLVLYNLEGVTNFPWITSENRVAFHSRPIDLANFEVNATSKRPFFLVLGENYDNSWVATSKGSNIVHIPANWANGFYVNSTTPVSLRIAYKPQSLWAFAVVTTGLSWIILLCGIFIGPLWPTLRRWFRRAWALRSSLVT